MIDCGPPHVTLSVIFSAALALARLPLKNDK